MKKEAVKKEKESIWDAFVGKRIIIQAKAGLRYEGILVVVKDGYLLLTDATIVGKRFIVRTNLLTVHNTLIAHMHTEPTSVEEVQKS